MTALPPCHETFDDAVDDLAAFLGVPPADLLRPVLEPRTTPADVLAEVLALRGALGRSQRRVNPSARAVPKAAACRLLGIDRTTLAALIKEGTIRTVRWRGQTGGKVVVQRERIPASEIERLCEQGIPSPGERRPHRKPHKAKAADAPAAILKIPVD